MAFSAPPTQTKVVLDQVTIILKTRKAFELFSGIKRHCYTHILISQGLELYLQINGPVFQRKRHQQNLPIFFAGLDVGHCLESLINVRPFSGLETTTFRVLECCVKPSLYLCHNSLFYGLCLFLRAQQII